MEKNCFTKSKSKGGKGKVQAVLMNLVDLVCVNFKTIVMIGSGTFVAK